LNYTRAMD